MVVVLLGSGVANCYVAAGGAPLNSGHATEASASVAASTTATTTATVAPRELPAFPDPVPPPSSTQQFSLLTSKATVGEVADALRGLLQKGGHEQVAWYGFRDGFALISAAEQTSLSWQHLSGNARWLTGVPTPVGAFELFKALFVIKPGFYRVFVFTVSSTSSPASGPSPTMGDAEQLLKGGAPSLPGEVRKRTATNMVIIGYVYAFTKKNDDDPGGLVTTGVPPVRSHLLDAGAWDQELLK